METYQKHLYRIAPYLLIVVAFMADRLSKWWVSANIESPTIINKWITLRVTYNEGVAFGLFQGIGPAVGWISILIVLGMVYYLVQLPAHWWLQRLGLGLVIGGALGNMLDRIMVGRVLDFVETPFRSGIFNVADVALNIGVVLVLVGTFIHQDPTPPDDNSEPLLNTPASS